MKKNLFLFCLTLILQNMPLGVFANEADIDAEWQQYPEWQTIVDSADVLLSPIAIATDANEDPVKKKVDREKIDFGGCDLETY